MQITRKSHKNPVTEIEPGIILESYPMMGSILATAVELGVVYWCCTEGKDSDFTGWFVQLCKSTLTTIGLDENHPYLQCGAGMFWTMCVFLWVTARISGRDWGFDAHWSLHPMLCAVFYRFHPDLLGGFNDTRSRIVLGLCILYSLELTYHWLQVSPWPFFKREDWRYRILFRDVFGEGLYFFPMSFICVYIVQLSMVWPYGAALYGIHAGNCPISNLDYAAFAITIMGLFFECVSDYQLFVWRLERDAAIAADEAPPLILGYGLWKYSRHPNYFGEICFWSGLYTFSVAAGGPWWAICGPLLLCAIFYQSTLIVENRMDEHEDLERRKAWVAYKMGTSMIFPLGRFRTKYENTLLDSVEQPPAMLKYMSIRGIENNRDLDNVSENNDVKGNQNYRQMSDLGVREYNQLSNPRVNEYDEVSDSYEDDYDDFPVDEYDEFSD
eukprot:Clim_evm65s215 gene=Clim_evmTU65s215